jgi:hypothetical protein
VTFRETYSSVTLVVSLFLIIYSVAIIYSYDAYLHTLLILTMSYSS